MLYLENDFVRIEDDRSINAIIIIWLGFCNSTQYRETVEQAFQIAVKTGLRNWIFDDRKGKLLAPEDQRWLNDQMIPQIETFFKKVANVSSSDIFRKIANDIIDKKRIKNAKTDLQVHFFNSIETAKEWLAEK